MKCFLGPQKFSNVYYIVGWMQERPIVGWMQERPIGARFKNDLSRHPVEERPISASGSRTTYLGAWL